MYQTKNYKGKLRLLIAIIFLTGCAGVPLTEQDLRSGSVGLAGGVVAAKAAKKVKDVFTPHFMLHNVSLETCGEVKVKGKGVRDCVLSNEIPPDICLDRAWVTCILIGCEGNEADCTNSYPLLDFIENKRYTTLEVSSYMSSSVIEFCKRTEACKEIKALYKDGAVLFLED